MGHGAASDVALAFYLALPPDGGGVVPRGGRWSGQFRENL